jgi:hypothetical protein
LLHVWKNHWERIYRFGWFFFGCVLNCQDSEWGLYEKILYSTTWHLSSTLIFFNIRELSNTQLFLILGYYLVSLAPPLGYATAHELKCVTIHVHWNISFENGWHKRFWFYIVHCTIKIACVNHFRMKYYPTDSWTRRSIALITLQYFTMQDA